MELKLLKGDFTVFQVQELSQLNLNLDNLFLSITADEISVVCEKNDVPENVLVREDGWSAFKIVGMLDFSLVGILAKIASILAQAKISIFAISTYNTDYILVKTISLEDAKGALTKNGYIIK